MSKKLIDMVLESEELRALNPENQHEEEIIYYTCPVNYGLLDNKECTDMPFHWDDVCTKCWNRTV